jgi:predicted RNase H-like HicB family nuclease
LVVPQDAELRDSVLTNHRGRRRRPKTMRYLKIIVEKHADGYVSYPIGMRGVVVGDGDTYEEAVESVKSAIRFHIETFGKDALDDDASPVLEAFVAEAGVAG